MSHGIIHTGFWSDKKVKAWPVEAKLLAAYFITGPHRNILGCALIPDGYIVADLGWDTDTLHMALASLVDTKFIIRDADGWTLIVNQLKHDPLKHENHVKGAAKLLAAVPTDSIVYEPTYSRLAAAAEAIGRPLAGVSKPIPAPTPSPAPSPITPTKEEARPAPRAEVLPPELIPDPRKAIFEDGLRWLAASTNRPREKLRPLIAKWIKSRGDPEVAAAIIAAQQAGPVEPISWIEARLKANERTKPSDLQRRRARTEAILSVGIGGVGENPPPAGETIDGVSEWPG